MLDHLPGMLLLIGGGRGIPFQYDLDNPVLELKFQSELSKITTLQSEHYDSLTIAEEAEAVKILMGKVNIPNVYHWIPIFNEMATGCDVPIPVTTVDDSCSVQVLKMLDAHALARYHIVGL